MNKNSSIFISSHNSKKTVNKVRRLINLYATDEKTLNKLSISKYRSLTVKIQNEINDLNLTSLIVKEIYYDLINYLKTDKFLVQSNVYLRCSRPSKISVKSNSESIGLHRESFYGPNMEKSVNIWTPIKGVSKKNTLKYIPNSHLISDDKIKVKKINDKFTNKFSAGHTLGFQYAYKKIIKGVNVDNQKAMIVPSYSSSIFSGNLIHGAAINTSNKIRFSLDFRVIRKKDYKHNSKKFHFASKKPYFIDFK